MKEFLITNFKELIILVSFLIEMIVLCVAIVKKSKKGTTLYTDILSALPEIITQIEKEVGAGNGERKLSLVLGVINDFIFKESGELMTKSERKFFTEIVEKVLETPQKKGE